MARTHGRSGALYVDYSAAATAAPSPLSYVGDWSVDEGTDDVDVSSLGDTNHVYVAGLPDSSGTYNGFPNLGTTAWTRLADGTARKFYLYPDATNNVTTYLYGTAIFSRNSSGGASDVVKATLSWKAASNCTWNNGF